MRGKQKRADQGGAERRSRRDRPQDPAAEHRHLAGPAGILAQAPVERLQNLRRPAEAASSQTARTTSRNGMAEGHLEGHAENALARQETLGQEAFLGEAPTR